jgi:hypothetical protein
MRLSRIVTQATQPGREFGRGQLIALVRAPVKG